MNLDWSKIDSYEKFQRLINHLFALECNSPGFIPSSPYIGADGGWDGYYGNFYPPENQKGEYCIQAKYTTKSFSEAVKHLKKEIKKDLKKAQKNKVEHLRIATNAKLKVEQVRELESLNKGEVKSLVVWHRENLELRIKEQPFLRYYFFGAPQHPVFVPWNVYFDNVEPELTIFSAGDIPKFKKYLEKVEQFILSSQKRLLLIHAPGGYGKSHLLREIARKAHQIDSSRQPWVVRAGFRDIKEALQEEIIPGRKYLLIFDDADRYLEEASVLLNFLKRGNIDLKLIFSLRSAGLNLFNQKIIETRCGEFKEEIEITDWSEEELIKLLRLVSEKEVVKDEKLIVNYYPNPYLIVWIANQLREKVKVDLLSLKQKFVEDVIYDTKKCLKNILPERFIEDLIFVLACVVPFSLNNKSLLNKISSNLKIDIPLEEIINRLLKAGILRNIGESIRFNPDMKGDIYLSYRFKELDKSFLRNFILEWISICPENLFTNISAASRYEDTNIVKDILSELLKEWSEKAEKTPGSKRKEYLNLAEKITFIIPEEVINLILIYLETPTPDEPQKAGSTYFSTPKIVPTTDDYGPVILNLLKNSSYRKEVIDIIIKLAELVTLKKSDIVKEGIYDNYKPYSLIKESVSPLRNTSEIIISTLNIISEWLNNPNKVTLRLINTALSEVLAGTHEFSRSYLDKFEIGERPLVKHPKVIDFRKKALDILKSMISHPQVEVQIEGIKVAENIGRTIMGRFSEKDLPLAEVFAEERREIVKVIGGLINPNADFLLLSVIEDLFIKWWANEKSGSEKVVDYLRKFPRTPEYLIFRWFATRDYYIKNFTEIEQRAPSQNKWEWFVEEVISKKWEMKPKDFSDIVNELSVKYDTPQKLIGFLKDLDSKLSRLEQEVYPPFLFLIQWIKTNPNIFGNLRDDAEFWEQIPKRFKEEIEFILAKLDPPRFNKIAEELFKSEKIPSEEKNRAERFLWELPEDLSNDSKRWIEELIVKGDADINSQLLRKFYFIFKKTGDIETIANYVFKILMDKEITDSILDMLDFLLFHLWKEIDKIPQKKEMIRKILINKLKDISEIKYHTQELLKLCIVNIDETLEFIEFRLKKEKKLREEKVQTGTIYSRKEFEAIPFDGIKCIKEKIRSFDDYWKFIQKIIEWYKSDICRSNFEIKNLMKETTLLQEKGTDEICLIKCIQILLKEEKLEDAAICMEFLPLTQQTIDVFIEFSETAIEMNQYELAKSVLFQKAWPEGGFSSQLGEPPPAFLRIKNIFRKMREKATSKRLKSLINQCIDQVEKTIEEHITRDKELLFPKR